jgi:DNA-binding XRE family transcriptional regulator
MSSVPINGSVKMAAETMAYEMVKGEALADPAVRAAYEALESAQQIARLRLLRGLTQAQLAALVGTQQSSIARLERGTTAPNLAFLRKVAAALGARVEVRVTPTE